ncbi:hypothetical protein KUV65_15575 [Maritalea mobilis]|uniref:hypothetical protein n=1 Tax=Maritalea mobilis TaxID=483324 RepID=UPI001C9534FA|nr:hypothetical protein [Maritalea mobilis]MBY6202795.1 hypothetical protein [Maritalea mobilis]
MTQAIDPDLIGIWIVQGQPQTYEVTPDGGYHVADPEEPLSFSEGGAVMTWGSLTFTRTVGTGETPVGGWTEDASGDQWAFAKDGTYTVSARGLSDTGIWDLRDNGASLWTREKRATITSDGAHLEFLTVYGTTSRYGYTVSNGVWRLLDPANWDELARYLSAAKLMELAGQA